LIFHQEEMPKAVQQLNGFRCSSFREE
jgi:hypothetical protein